MTITFGFYDSISSDRLYDAKQMGSIFDGLILDGVYANYGNGLVVVEDTGMQVSVGTGRTWFDHTWTYNDAALLKTIATADAILNRIDIVYLEVNENVGVRANSINVLTGTPASSPVPPDLTNTSTIHQYALAHIYVGAGVTEIVQANITNMIGTENTPYVALVWESEDLQDQIWAIVGDTNPPLIDLLELKPHNHDGSPTVQIGPSGLATDAVIAGKIADAGVVAGNLASGAVSATGQLANNIVDDAKIGNRVTALIKRQGGSATDWSTLGNTNYIPDAVRMQAGVRGLTVAADNTFFSYTLTWPIAFAYPPIVLATIEYDMVKLTVVTKNITTTGCNLIISTGDGSQFGFIITFPIHWLAIGPE